MRKNNLNLLTIYVICLGVCLFKTSCSNMQKDEVLPSSNKKSTANNSSLTQSSTPSISSDCNFTTESFDFYGGQNILVGNILVTNDENNLYVTYNTSDGWEIGQTHLYVGSLEGLPINKSNTPIPGHFPYKNTFAPYVTQYTYSIPLNALPPCYIIAAHAETHLINNGQSIQTETAWSYGTPFPGTNRWGWYSNYCTQTCEGGGGVDDGGGRPG